MRRFLLAFGWLSVAGSLIDAAIALLLARHVLAGEAPLWMTVDDHVRGRLPWLYWARDVAEWLLPDPFVGWLFGLPALVFFPARLIVSGIFGSWALNAARRMERSDKSN